MSSDRWYWCFTHQRVEADSERDDPENALGPYATAEEAANWRAQVADRNEHWTADAKAWDEGWIDDDQDEGEETTDRSAADRDLI